MSSILFSLPEIFEHYKKWVSKNPLIASDFETSAKWISYFIAGRINNSSILSELIYCLSNLLVLFNDCIIKNSRKIYIPQSGDHLKVYLTVVEYSEVFFELSAKKLWGEYGRWLLITIVQVFKCVAKLSLLYRHQEPIIPNPPIPALQRQKIVHNDLNTTEDTLLMNDPHHSAMSFTLQRSGRVIRKISVSPPNMLRDWKPLPASTATTSTNLQNGQPVTSIIPDLNITKNILIAETLYIIKPLIHLGAMKFCGKKAWKPWVIALLIDLTSMHIYHNHRRKSKLDFNQQREMSRRAVVFLLYLLRSPFYDKYTKRRLENTLKGLANNVPLVNIICNPIVQYLPVWQDTYFYMWST